MPKNQIITYDFNPNLTVLQIFLNKKTDNFVQN